MSINLSATEMRVIGCLMEKSVVTPDQYPLTLNALTHACNQKSSREPVMALNPGQVQKTVRDLEVRRLVRIEENFRSSIEKYSQRLCNSAYSEMQFDEAEFAIICLLLLRGPQTPGEIRSRSGRLHGFDDHAAVVAALTGLLEREGEPLLIKLPRTAGRKDSEYMHLLGGDIDVEAYAAEAAEKPASSGSSRPSVGDLEQRVSELERQVAELRQQLGLED